MTGSRFKDDELGGLGATVESGATVDDALGGSRASLDDKTASFVSCSTFNRLAVSTPFKTSDVTSFNF